MNQQSKIASLLFISSALMFFATPRTPAQSTGTDSPPIPEEARKYYVMGTTIMNEAKNTEDFSLAVSKFTQATKLAPQWPDARWNLAVAREAAGDYSGAMADWKIYLQFKLPDDKTRKIQDKIYVLEAKAEKAAKAAEAKPKESGPEAIAAKQENEAKAARNLWLQLKAKYDGATYRQKCCSYTADFPPGGESWPCGCNEKEANSRNWYDGFRGNRLSTVHLAFFSNGTMVFTGDDGHYPFLRGTPKGISESSIFWECNSGNADAPKWIPCWTNGRGLDGLIYSRTGGGWRGRPIDKSQYDPSARYDYTEFTVQR